MHKHIVDKQLFFNWYFKKIPKEQISAFISPYFLGLPTKDAHFSLTDILHSISSIPTSLIPTYSGTKTIVPTTQVRLSK